MRLLPSASTLLVAALALPACVAPLPAGGEPSVDLGVAAIPDVNASSPSFEQSLHPDDYQGMVSAWYFGHAT